MNILAATPLGAGDCEAISAGFLTQPVNALSSLAYIAAGLVVIVHAHRRNQLNNRLVGWLIVVVGIGSLLYHGLPDVPGARFVHDAAIAALLGGVTVWCRPHLVERTWMTGGAGVMLMLALFPGVSGLVLGALGGVAAWTVAATLWVDPRWRGRLAVIGVTMAAATAVGVLGRTGGAWCAPGSLVQPHAAWHVLTALAAALVATSPRVAASSAG